VTQNNESIIVIVNCVNGVSEFCWKIVEFTPVHFAVTPSLIFGTNAHE
jgi:hypothetical protein